MLGPQSSFEYTLSAFQPAAALERVLEPRRAQVEQGARWRGTGVYMGVHEDFESARNAAMASAAGFKTCS